MIDEKKLKQVYSTLQQGGYNEDYNTFKSGFTGNNNYSNRKQVYDLLSTHGANIGSSYEEFMRLMQKPKAGHTPMSEADKTRFIVGANNIAYQGQQTVKNAGHYNNLKQRKQKQQKDFGRVNIGAHQTPYGGDANNVLKDEGTGQYVTSDSETTNNLAEAQEKQAVLDEYGKAYQNAVDTGEIPSVFDVRDKKGNYDLQENIGKDGTYLTEEGAQNQLERKLQDAYARKKEIKDAIAEDNQKNGNPLLSYSASLGGGNGRDAESSDYRNKLATSLALVTQQIGALEAVKQYPTSSWGKDAWKALDNTAFTAKTWDFGLTDFATMGQMERIKTKMDNNIPLSGSDKMLLNSKLGADAAAALEDEKMGNIYRWTKIAGQSLPFMADFFLTGGYGGITKAMERGALKFAAKRGMGKVSAAILKNTGIVMGDVIGSYAMAGTEQALKTGADIMQRHMGNLYLDENGNYAFGTFDENGNLLHEGGETIGKALYKGLTSAMVENYTEKLFGHNYGIKKGALNFMEKHGMGRAADFFKNIGQSGWYRGSKKWMEKFGINGFGEEVMEEEIGIPLHALLDGDNKMSDLLDPKQQLDIIGGMAISVGSMYAMGMGTKPIKGAYNRAQYYRFKHKVDLADSDAQQLLGDNWESWKEQMDNATNDKMGGVLYNILQQRDKMSKEQINAAIQYGVNLMKMRGYNLTKTAEMNAREITNEPTTPEEEKQEKIDNAYAEGHEAEGVDTHEIQIDQADKQKSLAAMLSISEQQLSAMSDEELDALTGQNDNLDRAIYEYQLSNAKYQGVMDNANDKVDMEAQKAASMTDMITDQTRGTVRNATIKGTQGAEDYGVYIINGNLATHDDGAINISGSDKMIIYYDPQTGKVEHADASRFAALGDENPADDVKAQAVADAKEKAIKEISGIIDGKVEVGTQFDVTDADGTQHTYEVLADNGDGTAMITLDGNVEQNPYSFEDLQNMKDLEDQKRLEAAKQQRAELEAQREQQNAEQLKQEEEKQEQRNQIISDLIDDNGNVVIAAVEGNEDADSFIVGEYNNNKTGVKKYKVVTQNADGTLSKPRLVDSSKVSIIDTMSADEYKQTLNSAETSLVVDNGGDNVDNNEVSLQPSEEKESIDGNAENTAEPEQKDETDKKEVSVITLEDGTVVPMLEDGNPDFSQLSAAQTAELYDEQFGEDADGVISGWVNDAKKELDKANNMTVKGKNFVEQKASKAAKEKAIADAQTAYDSAKAIADAYNDRLLAKEENTPEGRRNLIDKARRKYGRLKGAVKNDAQALAQLYKDTVGSVLHRLYDGTGIDVTDDVPLTAEEYVASSITPFSLNYEGNENSKGVKQETGLSREDFANTRLLAKDGKGTTIDKMVDKLWNDRPSNLENLDTQDIRAALLDLIMSGKTATDFKNYAQDMRINEAEKILEEQKRAEDNAKFAEEQKAAENINDNVNDSAENENESDAEGNVTESESYEESLKKALEKVVPYTKALKSAVESGDKKAIEKAQQELTDSMVNNNLGLGYLYSQLSQYGLTKRKDDSYKLSRAIMKSLKDAIQTVENSLDSAIQNAGLDGVHVDFNEAGDGWIYADKDSEWHNRLEALDNNYRWLSQDNITKDNVLNIANIIKSQIEEGERYNADPDSEAETASSEKEGKFPNKLREANQEETTEVPEDATDEKPLGEQKSEEEVPFSAKDDGKQETTEERAANVEKNKVDGTDVVDAIIGKKTRKSLARIAKMMGAKIQYQYTDKMGNGWYDADTNTIYLTLDSSITKGVQFIFGHEMTHEIKTKNTEAYNELAQLVKDSITDFDKAVDAMEKRYSKAGLSGYDRSYYEEEVVADGIGHMLQDLNYAHTLALKMSHPLLAKIHDIINRIRMAFHGTEYTEAAKQIMRSIEQAYVKTANGTFEDNSTGEDARYSLRQKPEPAKKGIGYKVFVLKDGKLYPPMVANPNGAETPVGVWLDADAAPIAGESKTGRPQVKQGGKGTQGGSGKLAYRPGWHLGVIPYALQFNRKDAEGNKTLFPANFVFAEVEYAADKDYQDEAYQEGINANGKYQHSLAGLKHLPTDGYYMYRTNPNPETDPWVITGAMKVNRILTRAEQADLVKKAGREPQQIQEGDIVTDDVVNSINQQIANTPKFSLKVYHGSGADFSEFDFDHMSEGAGSQVFGWGGYVTSSKKIGKDYASVGQQSAQARRIGKDKTPLESAVSSILGQEMYNDTQADTFEKQKAQAIKNSEDLIVSYGDMLKNSDELDDKERKFLKKSIESAKQELEVLRPMTEKQYQEERIRQGKTKNLYEVNIPDNNGSNYLSWYEPLTDEQSDKVISAFANAKDNDEIGGVVNGLIYWDEQPTDVEERKKATADWLNRLFYPMNSYKDATGELWYENIKSVFGTDKETSQLLSRIGFTGITYPAGTRMGGAEEGDTNYVIFKPEDMQIAEHTKFSIKTWHGSQADFDKFDHSFMGSGEGAQAYGWGTYVSEVEGIAKAYAKANAARHNNDNKGEYLYKAKREYNDAKVFYDKVVESYNKQDKIISELLEQKKVDEDSLRSAKDKLVNAKESGNKFLERRYTRNIPAFEKSINGIDKSISEETARLKEIEKELDDAKAILKKAKDNLDSLTPKRNLYTVDIPDDTGDNYLGWDDKLPDDIVDRIGDALNKKGVEGDVTTGGLSYGDYIKKNKGNWRGGLLYQNMAATLGGQKEASMLLKDAGFDGVKVIAQRNTGGNKEGKMNYVIFDENNAKITDHTKFSLKSKPVRFEVGKSLSEDEKKEVLSTLKDAYKVNGVPYHVEETANGKEKRVYEPTADDYVVSDITNRPLRYYITLPDGRVAHPSEVYPNISDHEVKSSAEKQGLADSEAEEMANKAISKMYDANVDAKKALDILNELQKLPHETHDVGYGMNNAQSYNYKTGIFTSDAAQAIDYVVRRMRRKDKVSDDVVKAVKKAVADNFGMVDNLIKGMSETKVGATEPSARFSLKDEKTMFGMHNISLDKLRKAIKQGGFAAPSMGVIDSKNGIYSDYGEITLIPKAEKLVKSKGKNAGTFTADGWTPVYPRVELRADKKGKSRIQDDTLVNDNIDDKVGKALYNRWENYIERQQGSPTDFAWQYMYENGKNPEVVKNVNPYSEEISKKVVDITERGMKYQNELTDDEKGELVKLYDVYQKSIGKEPITDEVKREIIKELNGQMEGEKFAFLKKGIQGKIDSFEKYGVDIEDVLGWVYADVLAAAKKGNGTNSYKTLSAARDKVNADPKMKEDFEKWFDGKMQEYGVTEVLYAGQTPSGKDKYIANTIENAVKLMKKRDLAGGYDVFTPGVGAFIAKYAPMANTLSAMKKAKDKLIPFGDQRHNEVRDKIQKSYNELASDLAETTNSYRSFDMGLDRMHMLAERKPANLKAYIKNTWGIEVSDDWVDRYDKLVDTIQNDYPVYYFETKFMRPYGLDEFEKAIVPKDTPKDVLDALKKAGIDVHTYEGGNKEDREKITMNVINDSEGIKFSIKQFGTDVANASDRIKNLMNNEKIISRRIGSRAQAQSRVLATLSRASSDYRRANQASARSGQDTWEKDRALGYVVQASYGTGAFLTEEELGDILNEKVGKGNENYVYRSKDGKTVFKLNNLLMVDKEFRFNEFLDRIKAHNEFAPEDMYIPIGFALNQEGGFCVVLEQPYVQDGLPAMQEEIDDYMEEHGYDLCPIRVSADEVGTGWSNGIYEIWDTKPRNVLKDKNGDLHFIDTVIQHTFIDGHDDKLRFSLKQEKEKIVEDAKKNGNYMLAPNGKNTKLNAEQWVNVRTANFKKWFGDWENDPKNASKVVDENGEPMVVYHGRSTDFNTFEKKEGVRFVMGLEDKVKAEGFFFSPDKGLAEEFAGNAARHRGGRENVVPCFLNIRKPMDLTADDFDKTYEDVTGWNFNVGMDSQDNMWEIMDEEGMADKIKAKGYDGAIFVEEVDDNYEPTNISYCALDANQIKSADNNNGEYSAGKNDIRYSLRVDQFEHDLDQWKKDNNLPKDAVRPAIPIREPNESADDFLKRVKEYRKRMALWKTAPKLESHLMTSDTAQGQFNLELQRSSVLARIALQDSMLPIRKAQEAIMKEVGVDRLNIAEDAYTAENRSHGKGKNEFEEYNDEFLQPLRKSYNKMMKNLGKSYDNVKVYMIAKHGLERNAHMAFMKALENDFEKQKERIDAYNAYNSDIGKLVNDSDFNLGKIDFGTWKQRDNAVRTKYAPSFLNYRYDKMGITQDYSGLSALFEGSDFEEAAMELVKDVETKFVGDTNELWYNTNAATKKILRDSYKAGMMSQNVYEYVKGMYKNYIPLRGWGDTNADQVWNYMGGGKGAFNQALKEAKGRSSLADDPIAYIENMAESGILINNKNWVKQHLLLLAENHPTSLLNVSKAWYVKTTDANGNEEWIPASPQITANMSASQVEAALDAFQKKMEAMKKKGEATQKREHLEISYPQTNSEEREHEVRVMKDGEEYVVYVNGDPQLAQAMNNTRATMVRQGLENSISQKAIAWLGRKMAAAYTSLSPLFIPSNYFRDFTMTLASTAIREDARYNYLLRKNMATHWNTFRLVLSYQNGTLREKVRGGEASKTEQMFYDFMMNGGETGFVSSLDVEDLKKKFKNDLKNMNRMAVNPKKIGHVIMDSIETLNRAIEDSNRFMVYMTSIQYGRSIDEAVNDAKDVTLNFNRKGTGEHGWQTFRNLYLFINPAIQSLQTLGALAKHHPFKFTAVTTAWLASGVLVPMVNYAFMSMFGGDDDKDKYWSFTKWDRRNNLIMWIPFTHNFVKIPLAQEFRGFYGVGDMIASKLWGGEKAEESWEDYAADMLGQVVDMLPLDPTGYDGNIAVSLMPNPIRPMFELAFNVDFTGKPLFKDSEYNKYDPNFTKAFAGTPDWLVRMSRMVNSVGNDYPDVQQNAIDKFGDPRFNLNNPAVVDHVLSSYLGGAYTMGSQILGVATKALNGDEIKMADVPLVSKFVSNPDDRPVSKKQGDEFWTTKERHDRAANTLSKLKKKAKVDGDYSTLDVFFNSDEYKQYKLDDKVVKKYEEDKKKERADESGDEYKPHKTTYADIYKAHATPKDDFEDLKLSQLYNKVKAYYTTWNAMLDMVSSQADSYYNKNATAIQAAESAKDIIDQMNDIKKGFLSDEGKDAWNAEDMKEIRELRKQAIPILEQVDKVLVERQKAKAAKK